MPRYTKRPDGRYMTHVTIGTQDNGKPKRKTVYAKTIRELEDKCAEIRRQIAEGTLMSGEKILVADWAREWLAIYKAGVQYKTYAMYNIMVNTHIVPALGQMTIGSVRQGHVQRFINGVYASGKARTAEQLTLTLNQIFRKAIENNLIVKNPAEFMDRPKKLKTKKRALTDEEKRYIVEAELDEKSRAFVYTLLYAGLRRGEALALSKNDIDIKNKTISVNKTLITKNNRPEIKQTPKSFAGNRVIDIPDILAEALKVHIEKVKGLYVFVSAKDELMSDTAFRRFWSKIFSRLNGAAGGGAGKVVITKDITPHLFRHTYATMLYNAGVDIKAAQYLLGHASINVTMDIYTHFSESKKKEAAEKFNTYISSSQKVIGGAYESDDNSAG